MGKLIDKLKLASPTSPQPIGFGLSKSAPMKPTMVLIASLTEANVDDLADYVSGADAGLGHVRVGSQIKTLHKASKTVPDLPWGWWWGDSGQGGIEKILKLGGDFVIFPPTSTPLATLRDDKTDRVLQIETSLSEGLLRTIDALPVNAVLVTSEQDALLTWHDLMFFRRVAGLLTKPLLVTVPSNVGANELQSLWDAGVNGIVVEVEVGKPAGKLNELRQTINELSYPRSRPLGKVEPLLPQIRQEPDIVSDDGEDDEEEE